MRNSVRVSNCLNRYVPTAASPAVTRGQTLCGGASAVVLRVSAVFRFCAVQPLQQRLQKGGADLVGVEADVDSDVVWARLTARLGAFSHSAGTARSQRQLLR